jgi:hypothetical protein
MELSNSNVVGRFIMVLFIFLCLLALSPMLFSGIQYMKTQQLCSLSYTFLCFIGDAMLPVLLLVILSMLIGYLKGRN